MDASTIPKGQSAEKNDGRSFPPGIYRNKDNKEIFITAEGEEGSIQADALMSPIWKDVWQWEAEVPNRVELLALRKAQLIKDAKAEAEEKKAEKAELEAAVADESQTVEVDDPDAVPAPGTGFNVPAKAK